MTSPETVQQSRESEKPACFDHPLMFPHEGRDQRAFIASGLGTEIAPGRFVLNPNGVFLGYLFSQTSDPQILAVLSETGLGRGGPLSSENASKILTAEQAVRQKVRALIAAGEFPVRPMPMHPGIEPELSPVMVLQIATARDEKMRLEVAGMRYVVRDENIVIPDGVEVSHRDILIAEVISQMQKREGGVHPFETCLHLMKEALRLCAKDGDVLASRLDPPFSPGLAGAFFFAHMVVGPQTKEGPDLKGFLKGFVSMATERGLEPLAELVNEKVAAVTECLDSALIPAAQTMDALRAYRASRVAAGAERATS